LGIPATHNSLLRAAIAAALFGTSAGHVAHADDAVAAADSPARSRSTSSTDLEEIIVTATRRAESVSNIPYNISATTEQELDAAGVVDFSKLQQIVPGLVYNGGGIREGGSQNGFILRGLNTDRTSTSDTPYLTVSPVSVYIDDTPVFANLHLTDIARVEVLRGPQGTLYGNGSLGGTIRFIYNEPDPSGFSGQIQADTSHTNHALGENYTIDGIVNIPLGDALALRISAGHTFEDGFIDAKNLFVLDSAGVPVLRTPGAITTSLPVTYSQADVDDSEETYLHAALKYTTGPFKLLLSIHYQDEYAAGESGDTEGVGHVPTAFSSAVTPGFLNNGFDAAIPPVYGEYQTGIFVSQPYHRHIDLTALELTADLGFSTVTSSSSYLVNDSDAVQDLSGGYQTLLGFLYSGFPRLTVPSYRDTTEHTFTQEVRWVSATTGPLNWVLGAFYQDQRQFFAQQDDVLGWSTFASALYGVPITTNTAFEYDRWMRFRDAAIFGELTYNITDRLQVTGGLRGFDQQLDISTITQLPICGAACSNDGTNPEGTTLGSEDSTHRRVLGKLNASYHVTSETMLYATASEGYRRGGANGLPTAGLFAQNAGFVSFGPDTVRNYELGVKGTPLHSFQYTADLFQEDWNRPQLNILTPLGAFYAAVNGNTARSRGVELSMESHVSSNLSLSAAYTYTQARLTSSFEVAGTTFGSDGVRLPGVPLNEVSLGADYRQPVSGALSLIAHADTAYRGAVPVALPGSLGGSAVVPGFWMSNANVGIEQDAWRAILYVDNLSNTRGITTVIPPAAEGPRQDVNWLSRPRTLGIRVRYKF
jgi:iron complex outermembrane receptor protein